MAIILVVSGSNPARQPSALVGEDEQGKGGRSHGSVLDGRIVSGVEGDEFNNVAAERVS